MNTMSILKQAVNALRVRKYSKVSGAIWSDPSLVLSGDGWRMTVTCSWRVTHDDGVMLVGADDTDAAEKVGTIVGAVLTDVAEASALDPVLIFEDGRRFEVFSSSAIEPWVVDVTGLPVVVASPSAPFVE